MNYRNVYKFYMETNDKVFGGVAELMTASERTSMTPYFASQFLQSLESLRQSLSCYVCYGLLRNPHSCVGSTCQHYLCAGCIGGKLRLPAGGRTSCSHCKDHGMFENDQQLADMLDCYGALCDYIGVAAHLAKLRSVKRISELIQEGIALLNASDSEQISETPSGIVQNKTVKRNSTASETKVATTERTLRKESETTVSTTLQQKAAGIPKIAKRKKISHRIGKGPILRIRTKISNNPSNREFLALTRKQ